MRTASEGSPPAERDPWHVHRGRGDRRSRGGARVARGGGRVSDVVRCCVVGGGPAGMMLGFLLARAGVEVTVLEKHADFLRDFRGDTIHPSTLSILNELGLLQEFLTLPHREVHELRMQLGNTVIPVGDFSHLSAPCPFIALMPQWDFLNFLARQSARRRTFQLLMQAEATELLRDGERVTGVRMSTPDGQRELRADLVVAADGRARSCASRPASRSRCWARPWTCSGSACHASRRIRPESWDASTPGRSSSRSTAGTTGSAGT